MWISRVGLRPVLDRLRSVRRRLVRGVVPPEGVAWVRSVVFGRLLELLVRPMLLRCLV